MGWQTIKRHPADISFSRYIREKHNWRCERCGKYCKIHGETIAQLEASHYHSRRAWNTRFDEENVRALCSGCHKRMGGYKNSEDGEYDLWMKRLLGEEAYKKLTIRAHTYAKRDDKIALMFVKGLIKQNGN